MEKIPKHQDSGLEKSHKQILWEKQIAFLNEIEGDLPVDENIKEILAALNVNGINTVASCGGHAVQERKTGDTPYPWILISAPKPPGWQLASGYEDRDRESSLLHNKLEIFLSEFYKNREVAEDIKLNPTDVKYGQFSLKSILEEDSLRLANGGFTEEEKNDVVAKLSKRQKEMGDFGQFLKSKFLAND